jgi:hypothetical protein
MRTETDLIPLLLQVADLLSHVVTIILLLGPQHIRTETDLIPLLLEAADLLSHVVAIVLLLGQPVRNT